MKRFFKRLSHWFDDRAGISVLLKPLIDHPVPPRGLWTYVFGSATLFMFTVQVVTGVALSLLYQPSSTTAYHSLEFITYQAKFGNVTTYENGGKQYVAVLSGVGGWAGIGLAAGLTDPTAGLGAVGGYAALSNYTALGGTLTVFSLPAN